MEKILETDRLYLRPLTLDDLDEMVRLGSNPEVMRYIGDGSLQDDPVEVAQKIEKYIGYYKKNPGLGIWVTTLKENDAFIGWHFLFPYPEKEVGGIELGYRLHQEYWGKGYATEMAQALVDYAFDTLNLERVVAVISPANIASQRVLEKCGFVTEGEAKYKDEMLPFYEKMNPFYDE